MSLPQKNMESIEQAIKMLLISLGEDPLREGLQDTPRRVAKMYADVLDGRFVKLEDQTAFTEESYEGAVMVHHIPFYAFCEHHLSPFIGHFGMAYVPDKKILGISKLVRIFRHGCKKITIQERITEEAVNELMLQAEPLGAICYVTAEHTCMSLRGVKSPGSFTTTVAHRGVYATDQELRTQFINEASKVK